MNTTFIEQLKTQLLQLPGEEAQYQMAPMSRKRLSDFSDKIHAARKSAVLIVLYPSGNSINTILIQRPNYEGVHGGQIAFPGGKFEDADQTLSNTALREANEEIGIDTGNIQIIGNLTDLYIAPSNFMVSPFIGFIEELNDLIPNNYEVSKIIHTDLFNLNKENIKGIKSIEHSNGYKIKTPYYEIEGFTVWGATAMMISELNAIIKKITSF
ncbi:MAG: CoA pyrophosphatase [Bacteroidetes bacterium]|nr:CoA pyrophosphatase [Bacteroidota bacterium]